MVKNNLNNFEEQGVISYALSKLINLFFHNYLPGYTTNKNIKTNGKSL